MTGKQARNGYVTLAELTAMRPAEGDVEFDGAKFRVRGLTSGEVTQIIAMSRDAALPMGENLEISRTLTVAFGLAAPDLRAHEDLEAARLIVGGMPPLLRAALRDQISALTWGGVAVSDEQAPEGSADQEAEDGERNNRDRDHIEPEQDREEAHAR